MTFFSKNISGFILAILWIVASNHCAFENDVEGRCGPQSQHEQGESHQHGRPCSLESRAAFTVSSNALFSHVVPQISPSILAVIASLFFSEMVQQTNSRVHAYWFDRQRERSSSPKQLVLSPNAPPHIPA
jgi:hypothetical protein